MSAGPIQTINNLKVQMDQADALADAHRRKAISCLKDAPITIPVATMVGAVISSIAVGVEGASLVSVGIAAGIGAAAGAGLAIVGTGTYVLVSRCKSCLFNGKARDIERARNTRLAEFTRPEIRI